MKVYLVYPKDRTIWAQSALGQQNADYKLIELVDDYDYWRFYKKVWGEPFIVVEHDVMPWIGAIEQMKKCPMQWCAVPYAIHGGFFDGLGCTKFPALKIKLEKQRWDSLHGTIDHQLRRTYNLTPHIHNPPALHMNQLHWTKE